LTRPVLLGLAGWSGSGKTTLLCAVLPHLAAAGLSVSTIKHAHHGVEFDRPGKDSYRHREAGAQEVLVAGGARWALFRETPTGTPDLKTLAARLAPVDLVMVEGFRAYDIPRLEIFRPALGKPPLWPDHPGIVAIATDAPDIAAGAGYAGVILSLDDTGGIARWIMGFVESCQAEA
jgi:molybdopterin-guanine dinucleotide biosynthesis protein B